MKYISICSGIEAATVAWRPLGWEPVAFAEIEAFPNAVLRHHYPNVPNLWDITKVDWRKYYGTVDIVVGGTPCQSFSVAGKREGMEGESGLVREYFRLLHEVRPRWFIWENVPGVLSDKGNAFQFILNQWHQCGYNVSYRVLDAQYWGVAQRRRRVFACGHLADWRNPAKVLFEWESLCRDFAPGRKARQEDTAGTQGCAYTPGSYGGYREGCGTLRATVGCASETLLSGYRMTAFGEYVDDDTASTLKQRDYKDATDLVCEVMKKQNRTTASGKDVVPALQTSSGQKCFLNNQDALSGDYFVFDKQESKAFTQTSFANYKEGCGTLRAEGGDVGGGSETLITQCFAYRGTGDYKKNDVNATLTFRGSETNCGGETLIAKCLTGKNSRNNASTETLVLDDQGGSQMSIYKNSVGTLRRAEPGDNRLAVCYSIAGNVVDRDVKQNGNGVSENVSPTLNTTDRHAVYAPSFAIDYEHNCTSTDEPIGPLLKGSSTGGGHPLPAVCCAPVAFKVRQGKEGGGKGFLGSEDKAFTLSCGHDQDVFIPQAYSFDSLSSNSMKSENPNSGCREVDISKTLDTTNPDPSKNQGGIAVLCAPVAPTMGASCPPYSRTGNQGSEVDACVVQTNAVRRLTPTECERLQGFPDGYTDIPYKGKPAPDGARYKALGNSMCVPVMHWIGKRIQMVEDGEL